MVEQKPDRIIKRTIAGKGYEKEILNEKVITELPAYVGRYEMKTPEDGHIIVDMSLDNMHPYKNPHVTIKGNLVGQQGEISVGLQNGVGSEKIGVNEEIVVYAGKITMGLQMAFPKTQRRW